MVKKKPAPAEEPPRSADERMGGDDHDLSSSGGDDPPDAGVQLDQDDSMFRPTGLPNRIVDAVPPLVTRRAGANSTSASLQSCALEAGEEPMRSGNADTRGSRRRTSTRTAGGNGKADATRNVLASDGAVSSQAPVGSEDVTGVDNQPDSHVNTSTKRKHEGEANHKSPIEADVEGVSKENGDGDRKGKKRREASPDEQSRDEVPDNSVDDENAGDAEEARNLRVALAASLMTSRPSAGESSTLATASHAQTPSAGTEDVATSSQGSSLPATPTPPPRRTFAAARLQISGVQSRPVVSSRAVQDPNDYRVRELPPRCEVNNPLLQDPLLREFYADLPNLVLGAFISWSRVRGSGQFPFSHWGDVAPNMIFENAMAFINFVASGRFINPARASPLLTRAVRPSANGLRMTLYIGEDPAVLISTMYVRQSHLLAPPPRGLRQHLIAGIGHTQEWERQVSFICMTFGRPELSAQINADVLTYSMRSDTSQAYTSPTGHFSATQSPSIRMQGRAFGSPGSDGVALSFNDPVPVYDARETNVDLSNVESLFTLPRFVGEVPAGSFAAVGYTVNSYLSVRDSAWHVSCNVRFVVVVGTPSDEDEGAPVPLDGNM